MPKSRARKKKSESPPNLSLADLQALDSLLSFLGGPGGSGKHDPLDAAQELIFDAWDSADRRKRLALAKKALALSPLCADAYMLLAQESAQGLDEAIDLYRQGVAAGEKALGKRVFRDDVGHFWGLLETRPYMRARQALAEALWKKGEKDEAVTHYQDMLRLNPNDNQGIRYLLIDWLLELGRDAETAALIKRYKNDGAASWSWSRALLAFRQNGESREAGAALAAAMRNNKYIAPLLLGETKMPRQLPDCYSWGGKDEAVLYVQHAGSAWWAASGALAWLRACRHQAA
jgi:tetratricopeptide (TPR) repeat protein